MVIELLPWPHVERAGICPGWIFSANAHVPGAMRISVLLPAIMTDRCGLSPLGMTFTRSMRHPTNSRRFGGFPMPGLASRLPGRELNVVSLQFMKPVMKIGVTRCPCLDCIDER